jgi:hypothetical protein
VPKSLQDRIGVLVVRATVDERPMRTLVVQLLEVNAHKPDRVVGIVDSSSAASRLVGQWLDRLAAGVTTDDMARQQPADGSGDADVMRA